MTTTPMTATLLEVAGLDVSFDTPDGIVAAVRDLSFAIAAREVLGIVGESGSGKTQACLAILGLLADNGRANGSIRFEGRELLGLPPVRLNELRGERLAVVFQDPMTALNPYLTIGEQMSLALRTHRGLSKREALAECRALLDVVQIPDAGSRLAMHPHELSGGMRQRVMIATALLCRPSLLIADEPTTALDVTVQAQILALLRTLRDEFGTAILFITHDLGIVAGTCDRMLVMQGGRCVEQGTVDGVFRAPATTYTRRLLEAVPRLDEPGRAVPSAAPATAAPVLAVDDLRVSYRLPAPGLFRRPPTLTALDGVSLTVGAGETLGVVGESGCGKSTLARAVLQLVAPADGRVCLLGRELTGLDAAELRGQRRNMQLVFQDPLAALDPRMTVRQIVAEPLGVFEPELAPAAVTARVAEMLTQVGLEPAAMNRYPHQFSGGQCQRIGIARALIVRPRLLVCDEAVSALDVTIQAQIVELLMDLQAKLGLSIIFIAHDLAVVRRLCHRVMVMYLGRVVELAATNELYESPRHPYTRALLDAVPVPDPQFERQRRGALLTGEVPSPLTPPSGCAFRTRCAYRIEVCAEAVPPLDEIGRSRVACYRAADLPL